MCKDFIRIVVYVVMFDECGVVVLIWLVFGVLVFFCGCCVLVDWGWCVY